MISFSLCVFVVVAISSEFVKGVRVRKNKFKESIFISLFRMIEKNRSRYGGYIVHLGIVLMFVGFTGHAFDKEKEFGIQVGQSEKVANYNFEGMNNFRGFIFYSEMAFRARLKRKSN